MIVYLHPKCSTCKNALQFLEKKGIKFVVKNIIETPPSINELKQMLKFYDGNVRKLFNTSGQLYREMGVANALNDMSHDQALELLSKNGMLIKRPFLIDKKLGLIGFNEEIWNNRL